MKKLISFLLFASLLILPANPIFATAESVSFFDALSNFSKVEDYKLVQSLYGNATVDNGIDSVGAEYRIAVSSAINGGNSASSFNRVNAYLKITNHNAVTDSTPFKEMTVQASGELATLNKTDLYFKLTNFNVGLKDALPFALTDIENAETAVEPFKGVWYHTGAEELVAESLPTEAGTEIDVNKYADIEEQFKTEPKEAILGLVETVLQDSQATVTEQEISDIKEGIQLALETKFFTEKQIVTGQNADFRFFSLNKASIVNFLNQFSTLLGDELKTEDISLVRSALGKVSLSGLYRIEDVYGLIDNLLVRFKMNDTGPLKNLEVNYRYKASDLGKHNVISAPSEFQEMSDVMGADMETETGL